MESLKITDANPLQKLPRPVKTYHTQIYERIRPDKVGFKGEGKTLLITGGATGIGFQTCKAFAQAGISRICIVARRADSIDEAKRALESEFPRLKVESHPGSITDYERMEQVIKQIGRIDVLVLSAFYSPDDEKTSQVGIKGVADTFATNVMGNLRLVQLFLAEPSETQRIVLNVTSAAAQLPSPGKAPYGTSKAAFVQMTTFLATEYDESKVRFISFHPGAIYTVAASKKYKKEDLSWWEDARLPGQFAVWLASPEAAFLNGRYLWAQWDVAELVAKKDEILANPLALKIGLVPLN